MTWFYELPEGIFNRNCQFRLSNVAFDEILKIEDQSDLVYSYFSLFSENFPFEKKVFSPRKKQETQEEFQEN